MILITRPKEQSKDLKLLLDARGYKTFLESLYSIRYYKNKVTYNKDIYYIFPSINSVQSLINSKQINKFREAKILAIGNKVKTALKKLGCKIFIKTAEDSSKLITFLKKSKFRDSKFIYLGGNISNNDFFEKLNKYNISFEKKVIYKTIPRLRLTNRLVKKIEFNEVKAVLFYSLLATETFFKLLSEQKIKLSKSKVKFICISERVAAPLRNNKFKLTYIADKPNQKAIIKSIQKHMTL
jgi:uroporphyrinogen-III synthase